MSEGADLSSEEVNAIREEMRSDSHEHLEDVNLTRNERSIRKRIPVLSRKLEHLCTDYAKMFATALRAPLRVIPTPLEVLGSQGFLDWGKEQAYLAYIICDGQKIGVLGFSKPLAFQVIEAMFGSSLDTPAFLPERDKLTNVEVDCLFPAVSELIALLEQLLEGQHRFEFEVLEIELEPSGHEQCILWKSNLEAQREIGEMSYIFYPNALTFFFTEGDWEQASSHANEIMTTLRGTEIEISVRLGETEISMQDLVSLREGDIVPLENNQTDPVPVSIEGVVKMHAQPMQKNGLYGIEIV